MVDEYNKPWEENIKLAIQHYDKGEYQEFLSCKQEMFKYEKSLKYDSAFTFQYKAMIIKYYIEEYKKNSNSKCDISIDKFI